MAKMAFRAGFSRTYAAGAFDAAAINLLFADLRATLLGCMFMPIIDSETAIDFQPPYAQPGSRNDDVPHWAFSLEQQQDGNNFITAYAVHGNDYLDVSGFHSSSTLVYSSLYGGAPPALRLWFACDSIGGWWWLVLLPEGGASLTLAGVTSRRYPSDQHQGLCARYGLWESGSGWMPAYACDPEGVVLGQSWLATWSPLGIGWSNNGQRHTGSPIPRLAVPVFPCRDGGITACLFGEFNEVLALTDGYGTGEAPVPGWIAFVSGTSEQAFALPAPEQFAA